MSQASPLLVGFLIFVFSLPVAYAQNEEQQLETLMQELDKLSDELSGFLKERDRVQSQLREQELSLSNIYKQIHLIDTDVSNTETRLADLGREVTTLESEKLKQKIFFAMTCAPCIKPAQRNR